MTVDAASPLVEYTVSGIGPYALPWPYATGTVAAFTVLNGIETAVPSIQYLLLPGSSTTTGNVYLTPAYATDNAGKTLRLRRVTPVEQGWAAELGARETGLEAALDTVAFAVQDLRAFADQIAADLALIAGGGGATAFLGLSDTPAGYAGNARSLVRVNASESGLEFWPMAVIRTIAGTADTPTTADAFAYLRTTSASAVTITIPPNAAQAFPIGTELTIEQAGAGTLTIAAGAGVTLNSPRGYFKAARQSAVVQAKKVGADEWTLQGDLGDPAAVIPGTIYWIRQGSDFALNSGITTLQRIFGATANGALNLAPGQYTFELQAEVTGMSATAGNAQWSLKGAGGATLTEVLQVPAGKDNSAPDATAAAFSHSMILTEATTGAVVATSTGTALALYITGSFKVTAAGTIIPSLALTNAAAASVKAGSWMKVTLLADNTAQHAGWT